MEGEIPTQLRMDNSPMLILGVISRIDCLHAQVETKDEVIEVQTQAQSVGGGYLLVELR